MFDFVRKSVGFLKVQPFFQKIKIKIHRILQEGNLGLKHFETSRYYSNIILDYFEMFVTHVHAALAR